MWTDHAQPESPQTSTRELVWDRADNLLSETKKPWKVLFSVTTKLDPVILSYIRIYLPLAVPTLLPSGEPARDTWLLDPCRRPRLESQFGAWFHTLGHRTLYCVTPPFGHCPQPEACFPAGKLTGHHSLGLLQEQRNNPQGPSPHLQWFCIKRWRWRACSSGGGGKPADSALEWEYVHYITWYIGTPFPNITRCYVDCYVTKKMVYNMLYNITSVT